MRLVAVFLIGVLAISALWLAGEQHRSNCIREQRESCSVLPWANGSGSTTFDVRTIKDEPSVQFGTP